jgi:hypothetical protein
LSVTTAGRETTAAETDLYRPLLRWTPLVPAIPALIAAVAPSWSPAWAVANAALLAVSVALMVAVVYGGRYESPTWRGAYVVYTLDLFAFFTLVLAWRGLHAPWWVDALLGAVFAATAVVGHLFRREIFREVLTPRTPLGLAFAALGSIGAGGAGALGYAAGRDLPPVIALGELYLLGLLIVLVMHAGWARVEDPAWQPARPRRSQTRSSRRRSRA